MKLTIKKTKEIFDITTWFKFAEPEGGESQWEEGRSAMEFARYMTSSNKKMPSEIKRYLQSIGMKDNEFECYPEEVTSYKNCNLGQGSGRHHDGLLVSKNYLVGIEAKVSEPFDHPISHKLKNRKDSSNMHKRIYGSLKILNPDFDDKTMNSVGDLMYQLISGAVGTIIESRRKDITKAAFLIIEFKGCVKKEKNYQSLVDNNEEAYNKFLKFLHLENKSDKERFIDVDDGKIRLWINMIKINIKTDGYKYSEE
jgi:hypothetical protein